MKKNAFAAAGLLQSSDHTVPGPAGQPLLGSMFDFQKDRLGFVMGLAREYGDVARYSLAHLTFYQVNHPAGLQHILQDNNHNYVRGALYDTFRDMVGNGLALSDGDFWLRQRRLMQPVFHRQHLAALADQMTEAAQAMLTGWVAFERRGQPIELTRELTKLHEEIWRGTLGAAMAHVEQRSPLGEYVVVLEGAAPRAGATDDDIRLELSRQFDEGASKRTAIAAVAEHLGVPKNRVYELALPMAVTHAAASPADGSERPVRR